MDSSPQAQVSEGEPDHWSFGGEPTPEEIAEQERLRRLDAFGLSMAKTRSSAISARETSGIEDIWREDEEFFEGVDDLNRGDERSMARNKPTAGGSGAMTNRQRRSRVFPNITGPFVESAAAHIADILLPNDDTPWKYEPTPIPELDQLAAQFAAQQPDKAGVTAESGMHQEPGAPAEVPGAETVDTQLATSTARSDAQTDQDPTTSPEEAFKQRQLAISIADACQKRVWDWQVEGDFNSECRKVIEDAARIGTGILKGPIPRTTDDLQWVPPGVELDELGEEFQVAGHIKIANNIKPLSKRVDPWNFYPANGCGENVQNGDHTWERDYITRRQLRALANDPDYIESQIELCMLEGPCRATATPPESHSVSTDTETKDKFEIWYCHGTAGADDLMAAGVDCGKNPAATIEAMIVMVNHRVIKASQPTTDYAGFPYDVFVWRRRANYWAGIGISRQVRTAQKIVVGATRSMMDNAGLAGGPMLVFKQGVVRPADGVAGLAPRKVFYIAKDDQTIQDATKAIGQIKVDIMVDEMMAIINFGLQMAENNSGFPMLMQGQMGSVPDRVGVVQVLDKNTNAIKRRLAKAFSDHVMKPHLRRYYIYHMMYGPDAEKGDLQINTKGYQALVELDIQNQELGQMYNIVLDPRFGMDPRKWAREFVKSRHMNPADLELSDDAWAQMLAQWQQIMEASAQQQDPRIMVEQIRQQGAFQRDQMKLQQQGVILMSQQQYEATQREMDRNLEIIINTMEAELDKMSTAAEGDRNIRKLKADIAREFMKIKSVFALATMESSANRLPAPPFEPPGLAEPGKSFQQ